MNIGCITGSGFYEFQGTAMQSGIGEPAQRTVETEFGRVDLEEIPLAGHRLFFLARHEKGHRLLSHMINHRANIMALKQCGVKLIIGTSVMGILDPAIPLASLCLFDDMYYPDNRLPGGEACTLFVEPGGSGRGHYIFTSPFSRKANSAAAVAAQRCGFNCIRDLVYACSMGPRFNTRAEVLAMRQAGCSAVSQTAGPEIVLAGECETAYLLLGFGVDYANGVMDTPTPVETLNRNLEISRDLFARMISAIAGSIRDGGEELYDCGFVYRFG